MPQPLSDNLRAMMKPRKPFWSAEDQFENDPTAMAAGWREGDTTAPSGKNALADEAMQMLGSIPAAWDMARSMALFVPGWAAGSIGSALGQDPRQVEEFTHEFLVPSAEKIAGMVGGMPEAMEQGYTQAIEPISKAFEFAMTPARKAGEVAEQVTGSAGIGYGIDKTLEALMLGGAHVGGKFVKKRIDKTIAKLREMKEANAKGVPLDEQPTLSASDLAMLKKQLSKSEYVPEAMKQLGFLEHHNKAIQTMKRDLQIAEAERLIPGEEPLRPTTMPPLKRAADTLPPSDGSRPSSSVLASAKRTGVTPQETLARADARLSPDTQQVVNQVMTARRQGIADKSKGVQPAPASPPIDPVVKQTVDTLIEKPKAADQPMATSKVEEPAPALRSKIEQSEPAPKAAEPSQSYYHGTDVESAKLIRQSGKLSTDKAKRKYNYSEYGSGTVYAGVSKGDYWFEPGNSRRIGYDEIIELERSPKAKTFVAESVEDLDAIARKVGKKDWFELRNDLTIDDWELKGQIAKSEKVRKELIKAGIDIVEIRDTPAFKGEFGVMYDPQVVIFNPKTVRPKSAAKTKAKTSQPPKPVELSEEAQRWQEAIKEYSNLKEALNETPDAIKSELRADATRRLEAERAARNAAAEEARGKVELKREVTQAELDRSPEFMAQLETRMKEIAKVGNLKEAKAKVNDLFSELAETTGQQVSAEVYGTIDLAMERVGQFREHILALERRQRLKETPPAKPAPGKQLTSEELKQTISAKRDLNRSERIAKLKERRAEVADHLWAIKEGSRKVTDLIKDQNGSLDGFSPETIAVIERAVQLARQTNEKFEAFVKRHGLDESMVQAMKLAAANMDRDNRAINAAEAVTGQPMAGKIVKQRPTKTYVDESGRRVQLHAPAVYDWQEAIMKDLGEVNRTGLGVANRTWDIIGSDAKDMIYWRRKADTANKAREMTKFSREFKDVLKRTSYKDRKDIMLETYHKQKGGDDVLVNMGMEVPTIPIEARNPKAAEVYAWIRSRYDNLFERINKVRIASGQTPLKYEPNFAPLLVDMEASGLNPLRMGADELQVRMTNHMKTVALRHTKKRPGDMSKVRVLEMDPFKLLEDYNRMALKYIHEAETIAWVSELLGEFSKPVEKVKLDMTGNPVKDSKGQDIMLKQRNLFDLNPSAANWIAKWKDHVAGGIPNSEISIRGQKAMQWFTNSVVFSIMSYNISSMINQLGALAPAYSLLGEKYMTQGVYDLVRSGVPESKLWSEMMQKSNVMPQRFGQYDAAVDLALSGKPLTSKYSKVMQKVGRTGMKPVSITDMGSAAATWFGAFRQAKEAFKLSEKEAVKYADDTVIKTQGSGAPADISPIQRTPIGKLTTALQTFALNNWDFITRDLLGYKNPQLSKAEKLSRIVRFMVGTSMINYVWEDVIGIHSPMPNPVGAVIDSVQRGDTPFELGLNAMLELVEPVPLVGPVLKYRSPPGGPTVDTFTKILNAKSPDTMLTEALRLAMIPGVSQAKKSIRAIGDDLRPLDVITGGKYPLNQKNSKFKSFKGFKGYKSFKGFD